MNQQIIVLTIPFNPSLDLYKRNIRYDDIDDAQGEALFIYKECKKLLQPKVLLKEYFINKHSTFENLPSVVIENILFKGKALKVLTDVNRVFAYIATCGSEMENFDFSELDMLAPYWIDEMKKQALRSARLALISYCKEKCGISKPRSLNPGSGNADIWPIDEQQKLFSLLEKGRGIGVFLNESFLMTPNKSISGLMFASPLLDYESCAYCERDNCPSRRVPFKERM